MPGKIHRSSLARHRPLDRLPPECSPRTRSRLPHRIKLHFILNLHGARHQRPGHDRPESLHRK